MRSDNYVFFKPTERLKDGYYTIPGIVNHVFEFQIYPGRHSDFLILVTDENAQQSSLHMWFSHTPLDNRLFESVSSLNPVCPNLITKTITIWDQNLPNLAVTALRLNPLATYYLNVRNIQSAANAYRLILP